jgi:hypothetical protein
MLIKVFGKLETGAECQDYMTPDRADDKTSHLKRQLLCGGETKVTTFGIINLWSHLAPSFILKAV